MKFPISVVAGVCLAYMGVIAIVGLAQLLAYLLS